MRIERRKAVVDVLACGVHVGSVFKFAVFVYSFFYEDFFERGVMQRFKQFSPAYLQFLFQQFLCALHIVAQHIANGEKARLLVFHHAAVWRYAYFAVGKGVKRVDCLVAACAGSEVYKDFHLCGSDVDNVFYFYLSLFNGFEYGVDKCCRCLAVWNLGYRKRFRVYLVYFSAYLYASAAHSVVVARYVDISACRKVGIQVELLPVKVFYGSVAEFVEIMRQYFR